jgi:hypothetical protein
MRPLVLVLCAALLTSALLNPAQGAEDKARPKKSRPKAAAKAPRDVIQPRLSPSELRAPYSALVRGHVGPVQAETPRGGQLQGLEERYQSNATSWKVDLSLDPRRLEEEGPFRFRLGREVVVDPMTGKELTPRADPLKARQSLKDLNLKGALESLGGKAEVQVDVLKF